MCKPCAFVFKDGCESGANCTFCHLCAPGEKKRRKKEKRNVRLVSRTNNCQHALVGAAHSEVQYQAAMPPPPPPPMTPWLHDDAQQLANPMLETTYHVGSRAWQLEKSQARCHGQYSY